MDNSLFADFAGSLERVKINGEERSFADCDGVILRPKDSDEPEFFWLSVTDQNRLRLSYPGPGPTETIALGTLIDLFRQVLTVVSWIRTVRSEPLIGILLPDLVITQDRSNTGPWNESGAGASPGSRLRDATLKSLVARARPYSSR